MSHIGGLLKGCYWTRFVCLSEIAGLWENKNWKRKCDWQVYALMSLLVWTDGTELKQSYWFKPKLTEHCSEAFRPLPLIQGIITPLAHQTVNVHKVKCEEWMTSARDA